MQTETAFSPTHYFFRREYELKLIFFSKQVFRCENLKSTFHLAKVKQEVTVGNSDLKEFQMEISNDEGLHKFNLAQSLSKANPNYATHKAGIKHGEDALLDDDNSPLKRLVAVNDNDNVPDVVKPSDDDVVMCCNICGKKMKKTDFQTHYNGHFNKCLVCMAFFNNKDTLDVHSLEVHGGTPEKIKVRSWKSPSVLLRDTLWGVIFLLIRYLTPLSH